MSLYFRRNQDREDKSMMACISTVTPVLTGMALLMMATTWGSFDQVVAGDVSPVEYSSGRGGSRQLSSSCRNADDALDPTKVISYVGESAASHLTR